MTKVRGIYWLLGAMGGLATILICLWLYNLGAREPQLVTQREYFPGGGLMIEVSGWIHPNGDFIPDGLTKHWYKSGTLHLAIPFDNGMEHGTVKINKPDGNLEQEAVFKNGIVSKIVQFLPQNKKRILSYESGKLQSPILQIDSLGNETLIEVKEVDIPPPALKHQPYVFPNNDGWENIVALFLKSM